MTDSSPVLGVDVGGTFTDVALLADGDLTTAKVATTPEAQERGVARAIDRACEEAGVDPAAIGDFRHASTVATNALLERAGATTALVTTAGFADVLAIGRQDRPDLYDHAATRPAPLVPAERRLEIDERATPDGVERSVGEGDLDDLVATLEGLVDPGDDGEESTAPVESIAVSMLHAYADPTNEEHVAARLREAFDVPVSVSHEVLGTFREYERTATTVADATVTPVIDRYLGRLVDAAVDRGLPAPRVMQSNGGIAAAATVREHAVTTALSGPAAGVVGASLFEPDAAPGVVSLDMGGTSCDVGLVRDGEVAETTSADVGDHPVRVPMVDVETVGAGGGSIAWVDAGGALRVGPRSAGADPGPACYDRGGTEPTVTDAALVLGYLDPAAELGQDVALSPDRAREALTKLAAAADLAGEADSSDAADGAEETALDDPTVAAAGVLEVANATMTGALRTVTVEHGHDPRDFALVAFGGAGPMHAAALADRLGIERVLVPRANGVLSALGLLAADERHDAARTHRVALADVDPGAVASRFTELEARVGEATTLEAEASLTRRAECRYVGQSYELPVAVGERFDPDVVEERFHAVHEREHGFALPEEPVELVTLRVTATVETEPPSISHEGTGEARRGSREAVFDGERRPTPVFRRAGLAPGATLEAPAIVEGGESTVVVPPDWVATVDDAGTIAMEVVE